MNIPDATRPIRMIIASDHAISRSGLRWLIESRADLTVVGTAGGLAQAVTLAAERRPDLVLMDAALAGGDSLSELRELGGTGDVRLILVADSPTDPSLHAALRLDVRGVIFKHSNPEALFGCIETVMRGRCWVDAAEVSSIASGLRSVEAERRRRAAFDLTRREMEIIREVVAGCSNKEIARRSSISENTVKCHLTRIFDKLGASNRVELALFAAHHRLLDV
jgi:DNA-binding NarL/FixJ family response regulator